jgi:hypothetical protein
LADTGYRDWLRDVDDRVRAVVEPYSALTLENKAS